jgi:hypothetical protein
MASQIHEGDIGTKLLVTITDDGVVVDLSDAISLSLFIKKPDGTVLNRVATLNSDGTDGKIKYITVSGDLDVAGVYKLQAKVALSSGSFYSSTDTFKVHCNL